MGRSSKLGNALSSFGIAGGLLYGISKGKTPIQVGIWAIALGLSGYLIGNAITKFYE
jgi:hypothetical protein